jgi:hypothetical protein
MGGAIAAAVLMTVETGDPHARVLAPSIRGQVELLLRKGREQRRNPSSFFGFSNPLKSA